MKSLILLVSILFAATAAAAEGGDARALLERFTDGLVSLRGDFVQQVYDAEGRLDETSEGSLALKAPRLFRWSYEAPYPQLIVADGDNVWIHDEDLEQVTVRKQSLEEAQSPLTVLTDLSQLDRDYEVVESGGKDGLRWITLVPKAEDASFREARFGFDADARLGQIVLLDPLGQRNEITFRNWQRNPALDDATFRFVPPAGVDVVGEPAVPAEVTPIGD
jgi:outer membrane lipoprotein carrier protein